MPAPHPTGAEHDAVGDPAADGSPRIEDRLAVRRVLRRITAEARHVRGPRTARAFVLWLAGRTAYYRIRPGMTRTAAPSARRQPRPAGDHFPDIVVAAVGARAAQVLAAAMPGMSDRRPPPRPDIVLADAPVAAAAAVVPLAAHPRLSVPAFDPTVHNPVGWQRTVERRAVALGAAGHLPAGSPRTARVRASDAGALAHAHHLLDVAAFHPDATSRAGLLARLAATGLVVHLADRAPELVPLLGRELHALMTRRIRDADDASRESLSIRMRRVALREHSVASRIRQIAAVALPDAPAPPRVSILLATMRPHQLHWAVDNVARQDYPNLELVLALHGPGFGDPGGVLARLDCPRRVLRLDRSANLGDVLNAATAAASGTLLTKMDDDDVYARSHVADLVLAHEYSGAHLVGKGWEHTYLSDARRTIVDASRRHETYTVRLSGGALLIGRDDLRRLGGWPRVPLGEDTVLIDRVYAAGGVIYRTHGAGYLVVRHAHGHTWQAAAARFHKSAGKVHDGWRPEVAGIETDRRPPQPAALAWRR